MAYDGKVMSRALQRYEKDRQQRREAYETRREQLFQRQPRLRAIENELRSTTSRIIAVALRKGTDPRKAVENLRDDNLRLQQEKHTILRQLNLPEDCLDEKPQCPLCGDTGYVGGRVCQCLKRYYAQEQQKELSRMLDIGNQSFDTFDLSYYPTSYLEGKPITMRQQMEDRVYETCVEYAHHFGRKMDNLLLFGAPGLGKTHLSAAIAREVSGKGYSVVYDTAAHVFERFEVQKFSREEGADTDVDRILNCDLLILDDLGTEMTTTFVQSALYTIVNTRLIEKRSTIINTNLSPAKLEDRYTEQIVSRIEGEYRLLPFVGNDIRKLKREQNR